MLYEIRMGRPKKSEQRPPLELDPLNQWVVTALQVSGSTNTDLAKALGVDQSRIAEIKAGKRKVKAAEVPKIARFTGVAPPADLGISATPMVPLVGYVGAGAEMHFYAVADNPDEFVPMPPGGNKDTVAVEVRGSSLGSFFEHWLVYYDQIRHPPGPDLLRQLCVVELEDGRVLVKRLRKGSAPGLWNLESQTEGLIEDVPIVWAAKVKHMTPK